MPKVISYTPQWLSRPSPGYQLFNSSKPTSSHERGRQRASSQEEHGNSGAADYVGPTRIIAKRGTEIFVVAGKHIRWTDLVSLKDEYEELAQTPSKRPKSTVEVSKSRSEGDGPEDGSYRVGQASKVDSATAYHGPCRSSKFRLLNRYGSFLFLQTAICLP